MVEKLNAIEYKPSVVKSSTLGITILSKLRTANQIMLLKKTNFPKWNNSEAIWRLNLNWGIHFEYHQITTTLTIDLIKKAAIEKRERLGNSAKEVDITVATIGDSRTGKSEMAEKMEGVLSMSLI